MFKRGWGDDTVADFANGVDKVELSSFHFATFTVANSHASDVPGGLLLDFENAGGGTLFLTGMTKALFDSGDVIL